MSSITLLHPSEVQVVFVAAKLDNFETLTSVLGGRMLSFVSLVSDIIHGIADEFSVSATRTNGESFLLVWRLSNYATQARHLAVKACVKILIALDRSPALRDLRQYPPLQSRIADFRVRVSMGIHEGFMLDDESVLRRQQDFDAFHVLPEMHVAKDLERMHDSLKTVGIFASGVFLSNCSSEIRSLFRFVDIVQPSSVKDRISVYCLEVNGRCVIDSVVVDENGTRKEDHYQSTKDRKFNSWQSDVYTSIVTDPHFKQLVHPFETSTFFSTQFHRGLLEYLAGEWQLARRVFEETVHIPDPHDGSTCHGPSAFLLEYMGKHDFVAPKNWKGFRSL